MKDDKPKLYIDTCPLIDLVKVQVGAAGQLTERQNEVLFTQQLIEAAKAGKVELYTSTLTIAECTHVKDPRKEKAAKPFFRALLESGRVFRLVQVTSSIADQARDLRWDEGIQLSGADGIHLATARAMRRHELLSHDGKLLGYAPLVAPFGLRVIRPSETRAITGIQPSLGFDSSPGRP